jgi:hypothetical protein
LWPRFGGTAGETTVPQNLRHLQFRGKHYPRVSAPLSILAMSLGGTASVIPGKPRFGDVHSRLVLSENRRSLFTFITRGREVYGVAVVVWVSEIVAANVVGQVDLAGPGETGRVDGVRRVPRIHQRL